MSVWAASNNSKFIKKQAKEGKEAEVKHISISSSASALEQLHTETNPTAVWNTGLWQKDYIPAFVDYSHSAVSSLSDTKSNQNQYCI